jgi:hypothetical protein
MSFVKIMFYALNDTGDLKKMAKCHPKENSAFVFSYRDEE